MTMLPLRQIERILNASTCSSRFRCRRVAGVSQEECRCERSVRELARELERSFTEQ